MRPNTIDPRTTRALRLAGPALSHVGFLLLLIFVAAALLLLP